MKMKLLLLVGALGVLAASVAQAQSSWSDRFAFAPGEALFTANELSLDLFGFNASRDRNGTDQDGWGPGLGVNYFVTENLGFSADTYAEAFRLPYLLNGSVIYRYPFASTGLAPYAFAGVGRQWSHAVQWTGHLGVGAEYRFNATTGVFVDLRGVFAAETENYVVWRFGVRLVF